MLPINVPRYETHRMAYFSFFSCRNTTEKSADSAKIINQRIIPSRFWNALFGNSLIDSGIFFVIGMFVSKKVPHIVQSVSGSGINIQDVCFWSALCCLYKQLVNCNLFRSFCSDFISKEIALLCGRNSEQAYISVRC